MWQLGLRTAGASRLASVRSIEPGRALCAYVSDVPHAPQKPRVTGGDELWSASAPRVIVKRSVANVPHATGVAPAARRQLAQWQKQRLSAGPRAS
jgi:hypothetical protein